MIMIYIRVRVKVRIHVYIQSKQTLLPQSNIRILIIFPENYPFYWSMIEDQ
jgi:hypothetical protein